MSSQQKTSFFKEVQTLTSGDDPFLFKILRNRSDPAVGCALKRSSRQFSENLPQWTHRGPALVQNLIRQKSLDADSLAYNLQRCQRVGLKMGLDFMGPFPSSKGNKYILMAVDYLSKWVEAKALPTNDARVVCKFLKSSRPDSAAVPSSHTSSLHRVQPTRQRAGLRHVPLLIELEHKAYWALKHANFDLKTAGDQRKVQLNELNELRDQAYENSLIYKEKTKRIHDAKIKNRKRYAEKRAKNQEKNDKTKQLRLKIGGKAKVKSKPKSTKVKVNPRTESNRPQDRCRNEEKLNGATPPSNGRERSPLVNTHGFKGYLNMVVEMFLWLGEELWDKYCYYDLKIRCSKLKLSNQQIKNGMSMSVQKSQVHKMEKFQEGEEIVACVMNSRCSRSQCPIQVQEQAQSRNQ
ncbi:reverse transcriptase domain-containing protein [Tanacetum coccineum]